jgi:hypothetical protein
MATPILTIEDALEEGIRDFGWFEEGFTDPDQEDRTGLDQVIARLYAEGEWNWDYPGGDYVLDSTGVVVLDFRTIS